MSSTDRPKVDLEVGLCEVLSFQGDVVLMECPGTHPPGTRLRLFYPVSGADLAQGKVTSVERADGEPPRWKLTIKLFAPSKAARQHLGGGALDHQKKDPPK
jgi:hypothetical protein